MAHLPQVNRLHFTDSEIKTFSGEETDSRNGTQQSKQDLAYLIFESLLVPGTLKMFRTICSVNEQHLLTQ